jgi:hypothetical protein
MDHQASRCQCDAYTDGIDYHCPKVKLQCLLCPRSDARDSYTYQFDDLTGSDIVEHPETSQQLQKKSRQPIIRTNRQVHHQLNDEENIDAAAKGSI